MIRQEIAITNPSGLNLRPAGVLCRTAIEFQSHITFSIDKVTANAKSVLSVLGACVKTGDTIVLECDGPDEAEAMQALIEVIESGLEDE